MPAFFAVALGSLIGVSTFFSYTEDWLRANVKAGNWDKEVAADWDSARNHRPCIGANDTACKYHSSIGGK